MRKLTLLAALLAGALVAACASGENVMLDEPPLSDTCENLNGRFRATNLRFTSLTDPGVYRDVDAMGGTYAVSFTNGMYRAEYGEPGLTPVTYSGPYGVEGERIVFTDTGPVRGIELGQAGVECRVIGDTVVMYDDQARYDFDGDGILEPAILQVDLDRY